FPDGGTGRYRDRAAVKGEMNGSRRGDNHVHRFLFVFRGGGSHSQPPLPTANCFSLDATVTPPTLARKTAPQSHSNRSFNDLYIGSLGSRKSVTLTPSSRKNSIPFK